MGRTPQARANRICIGSRTWLAAILLAAASLLALLASPARASLGYELDASSPSRAVGGVPRGLAVDQASQDVYVAISTTNPVLRAPGRIERFNSNLSADGVFADGGGFYTGVAVNPTTQAFYALQVQLQTPFGPIGTPRLDRFLASGAADGSFAVTYANAVPPIATDSDGRIFYPNPEAHSVQVFSPAGVLEEEITCGSCPGGPLGIPLSVAVDSDDDLYIADAIPDRVVELSSSGGTYSFSSLLQSGRGAGAVAVDPATGDVLVGDMPSGKNFHIVAYDSSGTQFDDFGAGLFRDAPPEFGITGAYQMAVNATTHKLYVGEFDKFYVFEKVTIDPPSVTVDPAESIGQLGATLSATVNANGHAVLDCRFEYTDEADFQANGFAEADSVDCSEMPDGSDDTSLSAQISGLSPATAYRYRVTAASNGGSTSSDDEAFETLPALPPTVTTGTPQAVGETAATLRGSVNPRGGTVSGCHFDFGTSASYGSSVPCATLPGPGTTDEAVSASIGSLTDGTAYHYRLVVGTNAGVGEGDDVEFTTASPPPPTEPGPGPEAPPVTAPAPIVVSEPPRRCRKGFRRQRVGGRVRCVKICPRGMRRKRVRGKVRCVRRENPPRRRHGSR